MIIREFEYSVAAASGATNVAPSDFNPIPDDGILDVYAVLDSGIASLTAPPKIEVVLGGATSATPVRQSSITGDPYALQTAGNFGSSQSNPVVQSLPVKRATNIQINLYGGTGATATGRIKMVFRTASEMAGGVGA